MPGRLDASVWKVAFVAILGTLLAQLDATTINVSLAQLAQEFRVDLSVVQWVTTGYLLSLTLVLPLNGWLVERIGARTLYIWCFAGFVAASALCAVAWSAPSLIAFRLLQGMSGGLLAPMAQMMIARAAGDQMTRVVGIVALPVIFAPVLGPVIAGFILQYGSWRLLFLVNLPVAALAFALALIWLPEDEPNERRRPLDWIGLGLLSPGLVLALIGLGDLGRTAGWAMLAGACVLLAMFVRWAADRGSHALVDLQLFSRRGFGDAAVTQFLSNGVLVGGQTLIPIYLIDGIGRSPTEMGWLLAPLGLGMAITYPLLGRSVGRWGVRAVSTAGALLAFGGTLLLLYLAVHGFEPSVLVLALFVRGMGQSAVGLPAMSAAYSAVARDELPMASTSINIAQRLGGPTLTAICIVFLDWRIGAGEAADGVGAYGWTFLLLSAMQALTVVAALRLPR